MNKTKIISYILNYNYFYFKFKTVYLIVLNSILVNEIESLLDKVYRIKGSFIKGII